MWINSFVVRFKGLKKGGKGLNTYLSYLNDNNHPNHKKDGHEIINFKNWKLTYQNMKNVVEEQYLKVLKNGKGGRPPSKYGQSITVNLPFHFDNKEQEREMINKVINKFLTYINKENNLNLTAEELNRYKKDLVFYNIHKQPKGSKTQLNIVMSEFLPGKKLDLSKKKYSYNLKMISNEVGKKLGYSVEDYFNKKEVEKPTYTINEYKTQELNDLIEENITLKQRYNHFTSLLNESVEEVNKTVSTYLKRVKKGIEEENYHKVERNLDLIDKNLKKNGVSVPGIDEMKEEIKNKIKPPS